MLLTHPEHLTYDSAISGHFPADRECLENGRLIAYHPCITKVPAPLTHCSPFAVAQDRHSNRTRVASTNKSYGGHLKEQNVHKEKEN